MKKLITATNEAYEEVYVDINDAHLNKAGTNMIVATFSEKSLEKGDKGVHYQSFRQLKFIEKDREMVEALYALKKTEQSKMKKQKVAGIRKAKKIKA